MSELFLFIALAAWTAVIYQILCPVYVVRVMHEGRVIHEWRFK